MNTRYTRVFSATVLLALVPFATAAATSATGQNEVDQHVIAQLLLAQTLEERSRGLDAVVAIGPANANRELRAALITLLEKENRIIVEADRRGVAVETLENPEFISGLSRTVAELKDPEAIPALSRAIYGSLPVMHALAEFGQQATSNVLAVVTSAQSHYDLVNHGLITLRFMVDGAKSHPLSAATLDQIRRAAQQRLTGKQYFTTLWYAIDLAMALGDKNLRRSVEALSSNRTEIVAHGITDPGLIAKTQRRAANWLAGVPAGP